MRSTRNVLHVAIPTHDLDEAQGFYVGKLGCKLARRYDDRITLDFFGDQVVCHLDPENITKEPSYYPRHFGITFLDKPDYDSLLRLVRLRGIKVFAEPNHRFEGTAEEHHFFAIIDPSNNILEFKYYLDPRMVY
ncbi:MAG: VOC family protein [Pseudomonadota bacterium]